MRYLIVLLVLLSGPAAASGSRSLGGDEIRALLPTITAVSETTRQTFASNGDTLYTDPARTTNGRWRVQRDFYCSTWPPSDAWRCYGVENSRPVTTGHPTASSGLTLSSATGPSTTSCPPHSEFEGQEP